MEEIRALLYEGRSSRELIHMGYAPGTVYKVQRQVRSRGKGCAMAPTATMVVDGPRPRADHGTSSGEQGD